MGVGFEGSGICFSGGAAFSAFLREGPGAFRRLRLECLQNEKEWTSMVVLCGPMRWTWGIPISCLAFAAMPCVAQAGSGSYNDTMDACAAFAADGGSAAAIVDTTKLSLEITDPAGKVSQLSAPLLYPLAAHQPASLNSCTAYFDRASDLVALGVTDRGFPLQRLQVVVADAKLGRWIGNWGVTSTSGLSTPYLDGFLEDTISVVVGGEPLKTDGKGILHGSFWAFLFDPHGQQLSSVPYIRNIDSSDEFVPFFADAAHNRLWFLPCYFVSGPVSRQPDCPISWTSLTGDVASPSQSDPRKPREKRTDLWEPDAAFAALDTNTVFIAGAAGGGNNVWLVDIQKSDVSRLILRSRVHFPKFENTGRTAALSPDGEVAVFPLVKGAVKFPYLEDNYVDKGTDFAVVQLRPLRLLGIVPGAGPDYFTACAIDHRQERTSVLVFREDHWERTELKAPAAH